MTERLAVLLSGEVSGYLDRTSTATAPVFRYADNYLRADGLPYRPSSPWWRVYIRLRR